MPSRTFAPALTGEPVKIAMVLVPPWKRLLVSFKSHFASAYPEFEQSHVL